MDPVRHNRLFKAQRVEEAKRGLADVVAEETHFHHKLNMIRSVSRIGGFGAGKMQRIACCVCARKTPSMFLGLRTDGRYFCQDHKNVRAFGARRIAVIINAHFFGRLALCIEGFKKSVLTMVKHKESGYAYSQ